MLTGSALPVQPEPASGQWAASLVQAALAPALLLRSDGIVEAANALAAPLLRGDGLPSAIRSEVIDSCLTGSVKTIRATLPVVEGEETSRRFDLTFVPVPGGQILLIGRDTTLEANLVNALAASRQLFRDLALCSNDFAFETDASAFFSYVTPGGLLGFTAEELHGSRPRTVFADPDLASLFSGKCPIRSLERWTVAKSGEEACLVITAIPMHDSQGAWCGMRGVVQDITTLRRHERAINQARAREDLAQAVVTAMRAQIEPRRMMLAAADALRAATGSDFVSITAEGVGAPAVQGSEDGLQHRLIRETSYHGTSNGRVVLGRAAHDAEYHEDQILMLDSVLPHLAVAIVIAGSLSHDRRLAIQGSLPC
jgi:PAS domain S-box-containing protein